MRTAIRLALLAVVPLAPLLAGCTVEAGPPPGAVVVGPGYYYDEEYVDAYGVHHPREYWYRDDHGWAHADHVPPGVAARDRSGFGYVHGAPPRGGEGGHGDEEHRR
jgi:hypothetical protein